MRILDLAARIARGEADIDDDRILGIVRVEFPKGRAHEFFVLTDPGPRVAAERRRFLVLIVILVMRASTAVGANSMVVAARVPTTPM